MYTKTQIAHYFDHTFLKAFGTQDIIEKLCQEAKELQTYSVCVNACWVRTCKEKLADSDVKVCSVIGFPLGQCGLPVKLYECQYAIEQGADEIDYVIDVGQAKMHNWDYIREEMEKMVALCKEKKVLIKVIFENCYLEKEEIKKLSEIARDVEPDFIKTSTGFGTGGAVVEDVKLMKETVGDKVQVKAAGGIRDWATCKAMIEAGATRIGTSSSIQILKEFEEATR